MTATDSFPVPDYANILRLDGKGFIVAGAGLGMGRQTAHALSASGAQVVCADIDGERAEQVAEQVGGTPWVGDITRRDQVERLVQEAESVMGGIDGLVDIVGLAEWSPIVAIDDDLMARQFAICFDHAVFLSQAAAPRIAARGGGTMVFVASVSGIDSAPNHGAYGAAKAALMAWMRTLAVELGPQGIRVNCVAPGAIHTPRLYGDGADPEMMAAVSARTPLRRMGEPHDIASAALYFSTPLSSYVTGRVLVVDGGVDVVFPYGGLPSPGD